jgi:hypothetical protein
LLLLYLIQRMLGNRQQRLGICRYLRQARGHDR